VNIIPQVITSAKAGFFPLQLSIKREQSEYFLKIQVIEDILDTESKTNPQFRLFAVFSRHFSQFFSILKSLNVLHNLVQHLLEYKN
jgi:hypothetical protein